MTRRRKIYAKKDDYDSNEVSCCIHGTFRNDRVRSKHFFFVFFLQTSNGVIITVRKVMKWLMFALLAINLSSSPSCRMDKQKGASKLFLAFCFEHFFGAWGIRGSGLLMKLER